MWTAKEAREESESVAKSQNLEIVSEKIKKATEAGLFCISFSDINLNIKERKALKELGYILEFGKQYNENYTVIKW